MRVLSRLSQANVVATLALFIALGGVSYAAVTLPEDSVDTKQLKDGAVTKAKIDDGALSKLRGKRGKTGATGKAGAPGPQGAAGVAGSPGAAGSAGTNGSNGADGACGPSDAYVDGDGSTALPANTNTGLGTITLPAGDYVFHAKVDIPPRPRRTRGRA